MSRWSGLLPVALAGSLALSCADDERAPPLTQGTTQLEVPVARLPATSDAFFEVRCPTTFSDYPVQCGYVLVPEATQGIGSEEDSSGFERTVAVFVMRVFSRAKSVREEPVVYLDGGPGASSIAAAKGIVSAFSELLDTRDLILFDQRGTSHSLPDLRCSLGTDLGGCFESLSKEINVSNINSRENAFDVERIRKALGYAKWNLYGISYGTRLALTVMRDHPGGIRSVVLDSTVPLEVDLVANLGRNGYRAFAALFAACASDSSCASEHPNLEGDLIELVLALDESPAAVSPEEPDLVLSGSDFVSLLFQLLYSPTAISLIPKLISDVAAGDYELLLLLLADVSSGNSEFSSEMHYSLQCSEEVAFSSRAALEAADEEVPEALRSGLSGESYFEVCEEWPVEPAPAKENEGVSSSLPSLLFAGGFDPITPPSYTKMVTEKLERSTYVEIATESHGASVTECGHTIMNAFFDDPETVPPLDCLESVEEALDFTPAGARLSLATHGSLAFSGAFDEPTLARIEEELRVRARGARR